MRWIIYDELTQSESKAARTTDSGIRRCNDGCAVGERECVVEDGVTRSIRCKTEKTLEALTAPYFAVVSWLQDVSTNDVP